MGKPVCVQEISIKGFTQIIVSDAINDKTYGWYI